MNGLPKKQVILDQKCRHFPSICVKVGRFVKGRSQSTKTRTIT